MVPRDYYWTLGLTLEASGQDIKKAYQILGNEEKRRRYDLQYRQPFENYAFYEGGVDDDFVAVLKKIDTPR